ncbi:hypothetical protein BCEP27_20667 [Burkholderia cepacia]
MEGDGREHPGRDHGYFNEPGTRYRTDRANFWSLS